VFSRKDSHPILTPNGHEKQRRQRREYITRVSEENAIEIRPGVRSDKSVFAGTRIAVYDILEYLAAGMTPKQIVADFPELTEANVRAAVKFAAERDREQGNAIG
jgi:uncharacterized protein (DUF433 family)